MSFFLHTLGFQKSLRNGGFDEDQMRPATHNHGEAGIYQPAQSINHPHHRICGVDEERWRQEGAFMALMLVG